MHNAKSYKVSRGFLLFDYLQLNEYALKIRKAVDKVLMEKKALTPDLHGNATTEEYRDAIIAYLN